MGVIWFWTKLHTPGSSGSLVVATRQLFNRVSYYHFTFNKNTRSTNGAYFTGLVRRCVRGIVVTPTSQDRISAMLLLLITGNLKVQRWYGLQNTGLMFISGLVKMVKGSNIETGQKQRYS